MKTYPYVEGHYLWQNVHFEEHNDSYIQLISV